jgi:hypothetical protein
MGFGETTQKTYVTILDGKLAVRSDQANPKAVKRTTKAGKDVYELLYPSFTGRLKDVYFKDREHENKKWEELHLLIFDDIDHVLIQIPFPSRYSNSFLRAIKNADLQKPMTLNPWYKVVGDKTKAAIYINQDGDPVEWYYGATPETANGLPALVPYSVPGDSEIKYSDVERNKFIKNMVENELRPALKTLWNNRPPVTAAANAAHIEPPDDIEPGSITEPVDDLPF